MNRIWYCLIMKKKFILLFIIILYFSCNNTPVANRNNNLLEKNYVIIPYTQEYNYIYKEGIPVDLTEDDIISIDNILQNIIDEHNKKIKINPYTQGWMSQELDLSQYLRQYLPVLNKNGEKEIFVNCVSVNAFSNSINKVWNSNIVITMDGGNNFFKLKINLNTRTYSNFIINGRA